MISNTEAQPKSRASFPTISSPDHPLKRQRILLQGCACPLAKGNFCLRNEIIMPKGSFAKRETEILGSRHFTQRYLRTSIKENIWRDHCMNKKFQKLLIVSKNWNQAEFNRRAQTVKHQGLALTLWVLKLHSIVLPYKLSSFMKYHFDIYLTSPLEPGHSILILLHISVIPMFQRNGTHLDLRGPKCWNR